MISKIHALCSTPGASVSLQTLLSCRVGFPPLTGFRGSLRRPLGFVPHGERSCKSRLKDESFDEFRAQVGFCYKVPAYQNGHRELHTPLPGLSNCLISKMRMLEDSDRINPAPASAKLLLALNATVIISSDQR